MKNTLAIVLFSIFTSFPLFSFARPSDFDADGPLFTRSQNPLSLTLVSMPMESPQTLDRFKFETTLSTNFSNIFEFNPGATTSVNFDMELWRTDLRLVMGLGHKTDIALELPFFSNGGGFLDGFVQGYHDLFGFPNGGRDQVTNGTFNYALSQGGTNLINANRNDLGFGDITLRLKSEWPWTLPFKAAIAGYLKVPTGQTSLGSGHVDGGLSVFVQNDLKRFHFVTQAGVNFFSGHDFAEPILRNVVFCFGQSVEFQITDGLSAIVQLTGNTSAFKNVDINELSDITLDLSTGFVGSFKLPEKTSLDVFFYQFAFTEDVMSRGPSVDFTLTFRTGVRY